MKKYSENLKDPRWQKKRLEIMNRDKFTCKLCGDTETCLNVHHIEYCYGDPWDIENKKLITLCEHCHNEINNFESSGINMKCYIFEKKIKIYKSKNWSDDSRIMFTSIPNLLRVRIYDKDNQFIIGYEFSDSRHIKGIIKSMSNSLKSM